MGLIDWLQKNKKKESQTYAKMLNGYTPIFSTFGKDIYSSDVIQQAVNCIVKEMKKLTPRHVRRTEKGLISVNDDVQKVLDNPNPLMTTTDFIEKVIWSLLFTYNSFVMPVYNGSKLTALYPISPTMVEFLQDTSGELFVHFRFSNNYESTVPYSEVIHIRYNFSVNEFMGGNAEGKPDHDALLKSLELNNTLLQGVAKALKSSFAINGVIKYNTLLDAKKTEEAIKEFTQALERNENGLLGLDMKGEFIPVSRSVQMVDPVTLKFIDEKILRHFGVPLAILTGDYTKAQYEAFFQKTIEPLVMSFNQAFTKGLFTSKESYGYGNEVIFYHDKLSFMTSAETIQYITVASNVGAITINEIRSAMGYNPLDDDEIGNTLVMSKNYGSVESVKDMDINAQQGLDAQPV